MDAVWRICSRMGKRIGLLAHGNNNTDNISELFFILFVVYIISMFYSFVLD